MNNLRNRSLVLLAAGLAAACAKHSGDVGIVTALGSPNFETRIEILTGTGQHADFHVADLNGDTFLDMAVVGLSGEMRVLLGNGTNFVIGQELQLDGTPLWIAGGDVDGDLDRDLVIVRHTANSTDVWLNDGSGTFTAGQQLPVGTDALAVVLGDTNNDGKLDVLVSRPAAPEIVVYLGDGAGAFVLDYPISLPGGGSAFNLQMGDVTRDGIADLIVADPALSRVLVYPGQGTGDFGSVVQDLAIAGSPRAVSIGDLSGDGLPDMVVSAFTANRFVVVTAIGAPPPGGSTPYQSFDIPVGAAPAISAIGDVTGDGVADLVACIAGNASMMVVPQTGPGVLGAPSNFDASGLPLRPFVGDFDHNGKNDLFVLSGLSDRINLWLARSNGELSGARSYDSTLPTAAWLGGGDLDGDGKPDIAVGTFESTRISLMARQPDGTLAAVHSIELGAPVFQVETVDLDSDGRIDLLASVSGGVKVLHNESTPGAYAFTVLPGLATTIGGASGPFGLTASDLDRDGDYDLAVCDFTGDALRIVLGTGTPFAFGAETVIPLGGAPIDVVAADFTADGVLDLAVSRAGMSDIAILRNVGNATFETFLNVPVGQSPTYLITADFNRDLRADLVVSNSSAGTITVLFGGTAGFLAVNYPAGTAPTALLASDLTGDGMPDILVTSLVSGDFRVLVGDGFGSFPELTRFPGTLGASDALLQDMDGDGKDDLMIASLVTNRVSLVRNIRQ